MLFLLNWHQTSDVLFLFIYHEVYVTPINCSDSRAIACDQCNRWHHYTSLSYIWYRLYGDESIYSFDNALQRLSAASQDLFDEAVRLERIFLRYEPKVVPSYSCTYTGLVQDQITTQLLGQQWSGSTPMVVRGDGNCLFNAISSQFRTCYSHCNCRVRVCP